MLEPMAKIRIYGNKSLLHEFLEVLKEIGVVQLAPVTCRRMDGLEESELLAPCEAGPEASRKVEQARELLRQLDEASAILGIVTEELARPPLGDDHLHTSEDLPVFREYASKRESILHEITLAKRYRKLCDIFKPVVAKLGTVRHVRAMGVTIEARHKDQLLPLLRQRLEAITGGGYQLFWRSLDEETLGIVLLFSPAHAPKIADLLSRKNIQEIRLPKSYDELSLLDGLEEIEEQLKQLPLELSRMEEELARDRERYRMNLAANRSAQLEILAEAQTLDNIYATRFLFVAEGYLPRCDLSELREALATAFDREVKVEEIPITAGERHKVPVIFSNPLMFRPFERLLGLLPMPSYGTLDPTPLIALSFPLFFGMVLGDVGYGALGLIGALVLWRFAGKNAARKELIRDIAFILAVASSVSVLFGFVYGEAFGDLGHELGLKPIWEDRLKAVQALLLFTVSLGGAHILLSFFMALLQNLRDRQTGKAFAKVASVAALAAIFIVLAQVGGELPRTVLLGATVVLVSSIVILVYLEGIIAAIELVSAIGNILSYTRLMALGLASAALAVVANRLAGEMGNVLAAIAVALILHGLNLVLGLFGSTVHGLRLHFVEFLPRFYKFGGIAYKPYTKGGS